MGVSQKNAVIAAYNKGYRITDVGDIISPKGRILSKCIDKKGYYRITIRIDGSIVSIPIHRLVAFQKFGHDMFGDGIVVRHLNGLPTDNSVQNISIGSYSENAMDMPTGRRRARSSNPKHNHYAVLSDYNSGCSYDEIMKKHNISSKGVVSFIINKSMASESV